MKTWINRLTGRCPATWMRLIAVLVTVFALKGAPAAPADPERRDYMVSAVLRRGSDGITVRLIHSVMKGSSPEEAKGLLLNKVRVEYEGYSVIDVLASPLKTSEPQCDCKRSGQTYVSF